MADARISIVRIDNIAGHAAHCVVRERRDQSSQNIGLIVRRRIGEEQDLAVCLLDGGVLSRSFAVSFLLTVESHTAICEAFDDLVSTIGRAVRRHEDFEF